MNKLALIILFVFLALGSLIFWHTGKKKTPPTPTDSSPGVLSEPVALPVPKEEVTKEEPEKAEQPLVEEKIEEKTKRVFFDDFSKKMTVEDGGSMEESSHPEWWVNSGGFLYIQNGVGRTIFGKLKKDDAIRKKYENYNPGETDDGYHPQNIFRLITKSTWTNFSEEAYFRLGAYNQSESEHRSESNGLLLFSRYQDGDNLYYAGVRVDGAAVIKKKIKREYQELAYKKDIFPGKYDREKKPNLLPRKIWIGLKTEVRDNPDGSTTIQLFLDKNRSGKWESILEATDSDKPIKGPASAGIRTDFMDVEFDNFRIIEL